MDKIKKALEIYADPANWLADDRTTARRLFAQRREVGAGIEVKDGWILAQEALGQGAATIEELRGKLAERDGEIEGLRYMLAKIMVEVLDGKRG